MTWTAGPRAPSKRLDAAQLQGAVVHYLLDLTWAGVTMHLSRSGLEVTSSDTGETLYYEGTLEDEIEWEEAIELFSTAGESNSFPFAAVLPVDVPALVAQGHDLASATGELSLWIDGTSYESRRVLLRGRLVEPDYGAADEPVNASLQAEGYEDRALFPAPGAVVSETTWPNASDSAVGLAYPFVFGVQAAHPTATIYMSEALLVDESVAAAMILLIAGHVVLATTVSVVDGDGLVAVLAVTQTTDGLGRVVSVVTFNSTTPILAADSTYYVNWAGTAGGIAGPDGSALGGAGDLMEHMLRLSTLDVDWGRVAVAAEMLNRFRVAGTIEESTSPWDWVKANLLPLLPVSLAPGPYGIAPIVWRYWAAQNDVVERLDTTIDPTVELDGRVVYDRSVTDLINVFILRYHLDIVEGEMASQLIVAPEAGADRSGNLACRRSALLCRTTANPTGEQAEESESTIVYDAATAGMIVDWWTQARALPHRLVSGTVGYDRAWLERGAVVEVTDEPLHLDDEIGLIEGIVTRDDGSIDFVARITPQIARRLHQSG